VGEHGRGPPPLTSIHKNLHSIPHRQSGPPARWSLSAHPRPDEQVCLAGPPLPPPPLQWPCPAMVFCWRGWRGPRARAFLCVPCMTIRTANCSFACVRMPSYPLESLIKDFNPSHDFDIASGISGGVVGSIYFILKLVILMIQIPVLSLHPIKVKGIWPSPVCRCARIH
jgi:hypothetical protein